jgi:hypothetical protein
MEDLREEESLRWLIGEVAIDDELHSEDASIKRCLLYRN